MRRIVALLLVVLLALALAWASTAIGSGPARPTRLDRAFGDRGRLVEPGSTGARVAVDGAGRILVAGGTRRALLVTRYHPDGSLDRGFGTDGTAEVSLQRFVRGEEAAEEQGGSGVARPTAIAVAADGSILVAGTLNPNTNTSGREVSIIGRLRRDGAVDGSFGGGREPEAPPGQRALGLTVAEIVPQAGKILLAGMTSRGVIVRLDADGTLDPTFGVGRRPGQVALPPRPKNRTRYYVDAGFESVLPGQHGTLYAAGFDRGALMLAKLNPDGSLDHDFAGHGLVELNPSSTRACGCFTRGYLARDPHGHLLVAGSLEEESGVTHDKQIVVVRFEPDGRLDRTFADQGFARLGTGTTTSASGVEVDRGGRIAVVGSTPTAHPDRPDAPTGLAVFRLRPGGGLDPTFFGDGLFTSRFHSRAAFGTNAAFAPGGDLLVAGLLYRHRRARTIERGLVVRFGVGG
jgi:uncharacterized delta-60 repeat protein